MTGAILNAAGIIIGGVVGLMRTTPLSPQSQAFFKLAEQGWHIVRTSAKTGEGVEDAFAALTRAMLAN